MVENLPFTVRAVMTEADLDKAAATRYQAYARHVPEFAERMKEPEAVDFEEDSIILLAESKLSRETVGTMRIRTNRHNPLAIEQSILLPDWLKGDVLADASRLAIPPQKNGLIVRIALFKAYYLVCRKLNVDWMVIAARTPLDRMYDSLLFRDIWPERGFIPLSHAGDIPHRVMVFNVPEADHLWHETQHRLCNFMCHTSHPDINLNGIQIAPTLPRVTEREREPLFN